jgi:hypothetical protein
MSENEVILIIQKALENISLGGHKLRVDLQVKTGTIISDAIIRANGNNIAAIEIKPPGNLKKEAQKFTTDYYLFLKIRYFIYTDGENFLIYDRLKLNIEPIELEIKGFVKVISTKINNQLSSSIISKVENIIIKILQNQIKNIPNLSDFLANNKHKISSELLLGSDNVLYFKDGKTDIDSFEFNLFKTLLDLKHHKHIYRYCSFERAFEIINKQEIALLGLPGMNDSTEPNYVENYLTNNNVEPWQMPHQSRGAMNRRFIMSCTLLEDDLMQWRLYGDGAKGAQIKFECLDIKQSESRFYVSDVKYAKNNVHPELDFLKKIIDEVKKELTLDLKFVSLYVWRHFFKPESFDYEKEVRILYIHKKREKINKEWIVAKPYNIVNPLVKFKLGKDEFPFKIKEIMLGPVCPEKELNQSQLEELVSSNREKPIISITKIKGYR